MHTRQGITRRGISRQRPKWLAAGLLGAACWVHAGADPQAGSDPLAPLQSGQLVVWVLQPEAGSPTTPSSPTSKTSVAAAPRSGPRPTYQEQESGSFGQPASSFGKDAGSYGVASSSSVISAPPSETGYHQQTAGSYGDASNSFGTAAGNYGAAANTYGQNASNFGVGASSTGQTAGSFGNSLGTIAQAGQHALIPERVLSAENVAQLQGIEQEVQSAFPDLHISYLSVDPADLEADLVAVQSTNLYPDLLIAPQPAGWWPKLQREFALAMLRPASFYADGVTPRSMSATQIAILAQAPHMRTAQAFALWMNEVDSGCAGCVQENPAKNSEAAAVVAASALTRLLQGQTLGDRADPAMATFPPQMGAAILTDTAGTLPVGTPVRLDLMRASANGRLAAIALRVIASSSNVFALAHPLVVLRRDDNGRWRVLHVSLNLPPSEQQGEQEMLMNSVSVATERHAVPRGIAQASPADGDTRPPQPELWWDNGGGATLQVVEWQVRTGSFWSDPHLYLAPDVGSRLRTQATARFADNAATYRWRIWSVGFHGEMKISPWSTLKIQQ